MIRMLARPSPYAVPSGNAVAVLMWGFICGTSFVVPPLGGPYVACVSWSNGLESCMVQIGIDIGIHATPKLVLLVCAAALLWPSHTCLQGGSLSQSKFQRLHELLQPDRRELWQTIPWKISLLDAQQAAAREHKPIFIWAMDGHPLGCT